MVATVNGTYIYMTYQTLHFLGALLLDMRMICKASVTSSSILDKNISLELNNKILN